MVNEENLKKNIQLSLDSWNNNNIRLHLNSYNKGINSTISFSNLDDNTVALAKRECHKNLFTDFTITFNS